MDQRSIDKAIGYGVIILICYHIVGVFIPILTWLVTGLVTRCMQALGQSTANQVSRSLTAAQLLNRTIPDQSCYFLGKPALISRPTPLRHHSILSH